MSGRRRRASLATSRARLGAPRPRRRRATRLEALRARADDIMLGPRRPRGPLLPARHGRPGATRTSSSARAGQGRSLDYRKIEKLERDPLFRAWIENPLFERVARAVVRRAWPSTAPSSSPRPRRGGTDAARGTRTAGASGGSTAIPTLQIWTALDDAPVDAGCVEVLPGATAHGLATPLGGVVPPDRVMRPTPSAARSRSRAGGGGDPPPQPPLAPLRRQRDRQAASRVLRLLHERSDALPAQEARAAHVSAGVRLGTKPAPPLGVRDERDRDQALRRRPVVEETGVVVDGHDREENRA